ncbi:MAG: energy transducer TonB [Gemmatimonadaceae bacterium]|nr:energy transducer TonB [Gemmatimonadaceae bacterium]
MTRFVRHATVMAAACVAIAAPARAFAQDAASTAPRRTAPDSAFTAYMQTLGFASWTVVTPRPGTAGPVYPAAMRQAGTAGVVLAQFIVDSSGHADPRSFRPRLSTDPAFTEAVRTSLERMQFVAAQVNGRAVKQLVQMPVAFSLAGGAAAPLAELDAAPRTVTCQPTGECPVHRMATVMISASR